MLIFDSLTVEQFVKIRSDSDLPAVDRALVVRALASSMFTLKYELDGEAVGMLRVVGDGAFVVVICDVVVLPQFRRQGIGTAMLNAALDRVSADMADGMWVPVMLTCSSERENYYKKFGFLQMDRNIQGLAMQTFIKGSRKSI